MKITYNSLSNETFQKRLKETTNFTTDDLYNGIHGYLNFKCIHNHTFKAQPNNIFHGQECPYCSGKKILKNYNDINTLRPDIADLFVMESDKYENGITSNKSVLMKCPDCGNITYKIISNMVKRGYSCNKCSDGISYPNKFIRALLEQYNLSCDFEWQPNWLKPYYFDSHFVLNDNHYVIEMDGGLGHGNKNFRGGKGNNTTDIIKDNLAKLNSIKVIRINCDYSYGVDRFSFIKENIISSDLSKILDLSICDFDKCNNFATSSLVVESAKLYNEGKSSQEIRNILKCSISSVYNWLHIATENGLCSYSKDEMINRSRNSIRKAVDKFTLDGKFLETYSSITEAAKANGLHNVSISKCCKNLNKTSGGFIWKYSDPNQPDKTKIMKKEVA